MRRTILLIILAATIAAGTTALSDEHHITATLQTVGGSGVTGTVQLTQLPHGGSMINVVARGLKPGAVYASFYYESGDCSAPADLLQSFTANAAGEGRAGGKIDDDLDEVGSVSVRVGPDYGTLLACASAH